MISVQDYDRRVTSFFDQAVHPTLGHPYRACGYLPMVELLRYLEANGFANYIASGGDRDFMRPGGPDRPALRLLLLHDDADREFDDRGGAEQALDEPPPTAGRWSAAITQTAPAPTSKNRGPEATGMVATILPVEGSSRTTESV